MRRVLREPWATAAKRAVHCAAGCMVTGLCYALPEGTRKCLRLCDPRGSVYRCCHGPADPPAPRIDWGNGDAVRRTYFPTEACAAMPGPVPGTLDRKPVRCTPVFPVNENRSHRTLLYRRSDSQCTVNSGSTGGGGSTETGSPVMDSGIAPHREHFM